ncbi:MAG: ABC transporter substrate-binding protein, partial [Deltaproteobacteria bacterium]|nr:ABC transporter substrate-binding protein [Deltaproteobacteria bacterium]
ALGYVEGQNISFEYRYAEVNDMRMGIFDMADELIRLKVDVLLTFSTIMNAQAAKLATRTTPIVFVIEGYPVIVGLVKSLARPGGNLTGLTTIPEIAGKRLEMLKETVPKVSRVAVLWNAYSSHLEWRRSQLPARSLGLQLYSMEVNSAERYESAFEEAVEARVSALLVGGGYLNGANQKRITDLARKHQLPAMYSESKYVASGGLMSYGADLAHLYRRAASYVDRILKGANPADLPVEQPTKFEFVVNLKTAQQIGLTIPPNVLARANRVIR